VPRHIKLNRHAIERIAGLLAFAFALACDGSDASTDAAMPVEHDAAAHDAAAHDAAAHDAAANDASAHDGGALDAEQPSDADADAGDASCLLHRISFDSEGGLVFNRLSVRLDPCRTFSAEERDGDGTLLQTCSNEIPSDAPIGTADINALTERDDVQRAIADAPVLFGVDGRAVDAPLLRIEIDDAVIEVGVPCANDAAACEPIPAGILELLDLGMELAEQQERETPACPMP